MYTTWHLKEPETDPARKYSAWKPNTSNLNLSAWKLRTASTHPLMLAHLPDRTKSLVLTPAPHAVLFLTI